MNLEDIRNIEMTGSNIFLFIRHPILKFRKVFLKTFNKLELNIQH